ncbi:MAG TPA: polysaccharide deacetylase family protein [Solirubrobacteraceae bacterium]
MSEARPIRLRRRRVAALVSLGALAGAVTGLLAGGHGSGSSGGPAGRAPGVSPGDTSGGAHVAQGAHTAAAAVLRRNVPLLSLPANAVARTVHVPILTWHRVAVFAQEYTKSIPDETVEPSVFAREIDALAADGYHPISQLQLFEALFHGAPLPPRPVLLTVDDGYVDDARTILPILAAHHFVATFYIITHRFHEPGFLNTAEVRRLDQAGMDIGAHTRNHVALATVSAQEMVEQIAGSKRDLESVVGHPVQWFAYPFGSFSPAVVAEVRRAGFVLAVTTQAGTSESSLSSLTMPRIHVGREAGVSTVLACTSSGACSGGGGGG